MSSKAQQNYNVRWEGTHANVSFKASSLAGVERTCNQLARQFGYTNTVATVYSNNRCVLNKVFGNE